jgi:type II secretory pathway component PulF
MPEFAYEALNRAGVVERGALTVRSESELDELLRDRGHFLIRAELAERPGATPVAKPRRAPDGRVSRRELLALTEYLWSSAHAGIPILTTLEDVEEQLDSRTLRRVVGRMREAMLVEGKTLSEAMAEHPRAFPALYVGTVQAGESTGQLDYVLGQLVEYLEWQQEIALQVRQATLYPIIVMTVMLGLIAVLLAYVYPRLEPIFTGYGVDLPLATRMVMATGEIVRTRWATALGVTGGLSLLIWLLARDPRGRLALDGLKLQMPIFGPVFHQLEMARVVTYMSLFYRTGIDLLRGMELLQVILSNRRIGAALADARGAISGGESIARAFAATGLFPTIVVRSLAMGEATGRLDESLERARVYYAREVPAAVRRMLAGLQPLLVVLIGGLLAVVALSIFMPIAAIYQNLTP